ncbi:MAG: peptide chain release factor N(5)-glutamine methyltransferase [Armatimonadetes bacterium]|nr:peptide chain release factor N(5)-glutamine methyltransferase [Armatimonadota bacterium]
MTRAEALANASERLARAGIAPADARAEAALLLRFTASVSREELFLRPAALLSLTDAGRYEAAITRRERREPLAYILGTREFYGLTFAVTPDVLVPRPETEGVVDAVLGTPRPARRPFRVLDLCAGSGAIAVAVAVHAPTVQVVAADISEAALAIARANAARHGIADRVTFLVGDLFAPVPPGSRFDCVAANPPYIAPSEIETLEPEVRDYEPRIALGVHADALSFYRRIAAESGAFLAPDGRVVVEVGQRQADDVCELFVQNGFAGVEVFPDLSGILRVVVAHRNGA